MSTIDEIVRKLSEVTDELLALEAGDFATRYTLETKRDELRAQAAQFRERKDEGRSTEQLRAELVARRTQLEQLQKSKINMASQAQGSGSSVRAIGADKGGTLNNAMMTAQGARSVEVRIAEIEQELARR